MQDTRLTRLVDSSIERFGGWLLNPWRRISLVVMSLLLGNFLATAISTTAGQSAEWDVIAAIILVVFTEIVNWIYYRRWSERLPAAKQLVRSLVSEMLNSVKIGLTFGLFIEAFKLGS